MHGNMVYSNHSIIGHSSLLDSCTTPMEVTMAIALDQVGRLMQLRILCASQIWT